VTRGKEKNKALMEFLETKRGKNAIIRERKLDGPSIDRGGERCEVDRGEAAPFAGAHTPE
jgi:hypothetical protein